MAEDGMLIELPQSYFDALEQLGENLKESLENKKDSREEYKSNLVEEPETILTSPAKYDPRSFKDYNKIGAAMFTGGVKVLLDEYAKYEKDKDYKNGAKFKDKLSEKIENNISVNIPENNNKKDDSNLINAIAKMFTLGFLALGIAAGTSPLGQAMEGMGVFIRRATKFFDKKEYKVLKNNIFKYAKLLKRNTAIFFKSLNKSFNSFIKTNKTIQSIVKFTSDTLDKFKNLKIFKTLKNMLDTVKNSLEAFKNSKFITSTVKTVARISNTFTKIIAAPFKGIISITSKIFSSVKTIVNLIATPIKFISNQIGKVLSVVNKAAKLTGTFKGLTGTTEVISNLGKVGSLPKILGKVATSFGGKLLSKLKFIPLIGTFLGFYQAYLRFENGEYLKGTLELIGAIAGILPGPGWIISIGLSALLGLMDAGIGAGSLQAGAVKAVAIGAAKSIGKLLLKGAKFFGKIGAKFLKRVPLIGPLISLGFAVNDFIDGNWGSGLFNIASGLVGLLDYVVPGLGTALSLGVDFLNWLCTGEDDTAKEWRSNISDFFGGIWDWIANGVTNFCNFIGDWVSGVWTDVQKWFGGLWDDFANYMGKIWDDAIGGLADTWSSMGDFFTGLYYDFIDLLNGKAKDMLNSVIKSVNAVLDYLPFVDDEAIPEIKGDIISIDKKEREEYERRKNNNKKESSSDNKQASVKKDQRFEQDTQTEQIKKATEASINVTSKAITEALKDVNPDKLANQQAETNLLLAKLCNITLEKEYKNNVNLNNVLINGQSHEVGNLSANDPRYNYA